MRLIKLSICLLFCLEVFLRVNCFIDPLSITVGGLIGLATYLYTNRDLQEHTLNYAMKAVEKVCQLIGKCEGCEDYWIPANIEGLEYELKSQVFGQPLAIEAIMTALKFHLRNDRSSKKALVLSFHGNPGIGKNFVSKKILQNMFRKGADTKYVKFYRGSIDFPLQSHVHMYKESLKRDIENRIYMCHRSIFVFDEVEKMPRGVLDVISYFVRSGKRQDNDYRHAIFILLSNIGGKSLAEETLQAWKQGVDREDMSIKDLNRKLAIESWNGEGGLKNSGLVEKHDIFYVPFLPLERNHIIQCLEHYVVYVRKQVMSPELTELLLAEMNFYPDPEKIFSSTGCKKIEEIANYLIEHQTRKERKRRNG